MGGFPQPVTFHPNRYAHIRFAEHLFLHNHMLFIIVASLSLLQENESDGEKQKGGWKGVPFTHTTWIVIGISRRGSDGLEVVKRIKYVKR